MIREWGQSMVDAYRRRKIIVEAVMKRRMEEGVSLTKAAADLDAWKNRNGMNTASKLLVYLEKQNKEANAAKKRQTRNNEEEEVDPDETPPRRPARRRRMNGPTQQRRGIAPARNPRNSNNNNFQPRRRNMLHSMPARFQPMPPTNWMPNNITAQRRNMVDDSFL